MLNQSLVEFSHYFFKEVFNGFWKNNSSLLPDLKLFFKTIGKFHIPEIIKDYQNLYQGVFEKINEGILYSDKAALELKIIFENIIQYKKDLSDYLKTDNATLRSHLEKHGTEIFNLTLLYATEHENRLIRGICIPKASISFMKILESQRNIIYFFNQQLKSFKPEKKVLP